MKSETTPPTQRDDPRSLLRTRDEALTIRCTTRFGPGDEDDVTTCTAPTTGRRRFTTSNRRLRASSDARSAVRRPEDVHVLAARQGRRRRPMSLRWSCDEPAASLSAELQIHVAVLAQVLEWVTARSTCAADLHMFGPHADRTACRRARPGDRLALHRAPRHASCRPPASAPVTLPSRNSSTASR